MRPLTAIVTTSFLALSLITMTSCSGAKQLIPQLEPVDRPAPDPVLVKGCPAPVPLPPRSSLPANDIRPLLALLAQRGDRGDLCAVVVEGWKAWDACMRIRVKDSKAACPALDAILEQLQPATPAPL